MVLDKPVKTYLMSAIKTALEAITEIAQVKHGQGIPIDQDTAVYPWCCFFDEPESKVQRNRAALKSFDLVVQVWVKKGTVSIDEQMDIIDAKIEAALLNDTDILYYGRSITPTGSDKMVVDDQETGILQAVYQVDYMHAWKNPYELVKEVK